MIDYNEIVDATDNFRNALKQLESVQNQLDSIITEADQKIGDCRHFIELKDTAMSRHEKSVVCRAIKEATIERRQAKQAKDVLTPVFEYLAKNKAFLSDIGKLANDLKKAKNKAEMPHMYRVRVLTELFGDNIVTGEVTLKEG